MVLDTAQPPHVVRSSGSYHVARMRDQMLILSWALLISTSTTFLRSKYRHCASQVTNRIQARYQWHESLTACVWECQTVGYGDVRAVQSSDFYIERFTNGSHQLYP